MARDKILEILKRKNEYVSGEEISAYLKITRQGLWKHIQELKDEGYDIVAVPHLGYRLVSSPDRLLPEEIRHGLNTKFIGGKVYYFETLSSTMDEAFARGMGGADEGTIVAAETQTKGRGRLGRNWASPKYKGIYASLILRPDIPPVRAPVLTLLASVAICEAVKKVTGLDARLKWPNDIFIENKKLAGILTEINAELDHVHFMVIGFGINVNNDRHSLIGGATSLKEQKDEHISRIGLLQEILRRIEEEYLLLQKNGADKIIDKWRANNMTIGRRVKIISQNDHLEGHALDIESDGGLLIRTDTGLIKKVMTGDMVIYGI